MEPQVDLTYSSSGIEQNRVSQGALGMVLATHACVLLVLVTYQKVLPPVVEHAISVSLIAPEARHEQGVAPKPLPVKPQSVETDTKHVKKTVTPKAAVAPKDSEPQLAAKAVDHAYVSAPEQKTANPVAEAAPSQPVLINVAEATPTKEEPVEQPRFNAEYLDNPSPAYPALSRKLREEGRVLLRVRVDASGHPAQVTMHESSGFPRLDERAADTVRRWKFQPARQGGQPVEAWVIVPIQFSLKG
jgi:protein TonB